MVMKRFLLLLVSLFSLVSVRAQDPTRPSWLSDAVFYQIYPSSFQDSDGNGIGDLPGITSRLDYIKSIGVTAIWLNPIYVSGWTDGGYDIIDFYKVDPRFGTNTDLVTLVNEAHARGLKVVMDLVAGHSSDQNEWFLQSREAENLRYSDYYIWPSFKPEEPAAQPGGAQDYAALMNSNAALIRKFVATDAPRGPYYVKNFFDTQPALNFGFAHPDPAHPWEQAVDAPGPMAMRRELKNIMAFWMDKGVDGFRVDMAASLVKNDFDKSATIKLWKEDFVPWFDEMYPEGILIAEWFNPSQSLEAGFDLDFFCHDGQYNYSTLFFNVNRRNGGHSDCYFDVEGKGELKTWYDLYKFQYDSSRGKGYVSMPSGNHDFTRLSAGTRTSEDQLKVAMTFFLTMPGVPFVYYGDEIGMRYRTDLISKEGGFSRTGSRTPMQWNHDKNLGFSDADEDMLYLPLDYSEGYPTVEDQEGVGGSIYENLKSLIALRKANPELMNESDFEIVYAKEKEYPFVYKRGSFTAFINPSDEDKTIEFDNEGMKEYYFLGGYELGENQVTIRSRSFLLLRHE